MARLLIRWQAAMLALAFVVAAGVAVRAEPRHDHSPPDVVGWRLSNGIVLSGAIIGADELQDEALALGNGLKTFDAGPAAEAEGDPTPLMRLIVSALSEMKFGRIELNRGRLTVEGIVEPDRIDDVKKRFDASILMEIEIASVLIDAPDRAPFHWSAVKGLDEDLDADAVNLSGDVADELSRGRLVTVAGSVAKDAVVIDAMKVRPGTPQAFAAANALVSQFRVMTNGFVWIYGRKFDVIGSSSNVATTNDRSGCSALAQTMPKGSECGIVRIAHHRRYLHHYYWSSRSYWHPHSYGGARPQTPPTPKPSKPPARYVAVSPVEASADLVSKALDPSVVDILYATLRQRKSDEDASPGFVSYSGERGDALEFGRARVRVPEDHKIGRLSKVNVITHSMGNFLVLDALANAESATGAMGQLIMAAPDVDLNQFVQVIPKVSRLFTGLTLYASSTDRALAVSMKLAGGIPRAGYVSPEGPIVLQGMDTLDVSALGQEMFGLNHDVFAQARPLIDDIGLILTKGEHAPRLPEELPMPGNASTPKYWRFAP